MKKKSVRAVFDQLPEVIGNVTDWLKSYMDQHAADIVGNAGGSLGVVIKLFSKPLLDRYFEKQSQQRLADFGQNTYLVAAMKQASTSLEKIQDRLPDVDAEQIVPVVKLAAECAAEIRDIYPVFQPLYHPLVGYVKRLYVDLLTAMQCPQELLDAFVKDFNEGVEHCVETEFGEDYPRHLEEIKSYRYEQNELRLLFDTVALEKIGFERGENLEYETTFAEWKKVSEFGEFESDEQEAESKLQKHESSLTPITRLIDTYFGNGEREENIDKILFVVADFGKGKSVFLRHYASELARKYLQKKEGFFPVYFNLRNFGKVDQGTHLGVIGDYLLDSYGIDIGSEAFAKKKYCFLIDSLDESGELNSSSIAKVVASVKKIQNIDKTRYRSNRIIVTSRPFNDGLREQLTNHAPYCLKNKENRDEEYFISLYGFKREQFNEWLLSALKQATRKKFDTDVDFVSRIFEAVDAGRKPDIYKDLRANKTLTPSELRRPIFAYMIYQLILNNVDVLKVGKIGIYLSFLNLLTKDAKHIKDPYYKVSLQEEFEYRNLLHATAALWMYRRHSGKQGFLTKADLCRVLEGNKTGEEDREILDRYKGKGVIEIEFLSHSYFGESDNTLHFQHQSFAEILLAEYYLKIFLKYALDEQPDLKEVKSKLVLGEPTEQTILFLVDLLNLLREVSVKSTDKRILELRRLLFPMCASLSTPKNNRLFSNDLHYTWYRKSDFSGNTTEYPEELIKNWCIDETHIEKVLLLCRNILTSGGTTVIGRANKRTALFDNEVVLIESTLSDENVDIDKWLALLVGNTLCNDVTNERNPVLFNTKYKIPYQVLFGLLSTETTSTKQNFTNWKRSLFRGIRMDEVDSSISRFPVRIFAVRLFSVLNFVDFSYSVFDSVDFSGCLCGFTNFSCCTFRNVNFSHCYFWSPMFRGVKKLSSNFSGCIVGGILVDGLLTRDETKFVAFIPTNYEESMLHDLIEMIADFQAYYAKEGVDYIDWIGPRIRFASPRTRTWFLKKLEEIRTGTRRAKVRRGIRASRRP